MGELPDQRIYGLFNAMDQAVMIELDLMEVGVGWRYLTAYTKITALGTQRGLSNFVRAENELLRSTWNSTGPAVAALELSPGSLQPPTYGKTYYERSTVVKSKTYRKKKLPQQGASSPPRCPDGSVGGDIVEVPGRLCSYTSHVVRSAHEVPARQMLSQSWPSGTHEL